MSGIEPTVGRNIWFRCTEGQAHLLGMTRFDNQPMHANIVYVWSPTVINLIVVDHVGLPHAVQNVLVNVPIAAGDGPYAEWMGYQIGQAKKMPDHRHADAQLNYTSGMLPMEDEGTTMAVVGGDLNDPNIPKHHHDVEQATDHRTYRDK